MNEFRIGDVVKLKSGGPSMTVEDIDDYSESNSGIKDGVECLWIVDNILRATVFDRANLVKA